MCLFLMICQRYISAKNHSTWTTDIVPLKISCCKTMPSHRILWSNCSSLLQSSPPEWFLPTAHLRGHLDVTGIDVEGGHFDLLLLQVVIPLCWWLVGLPEMPCQEFVSSEDLAALYKRAIIIKNNHFLLDKTGQKLVAQQDTMSNKSIKLGG